MAKRILLVDDEPTMLKGLKYSLEQDGYEILTAQDGEEALSVFSENDVDLVLLDVMLPKLDGFEVCKRIRNVSAVPIIILTAKEEEVDKVLGLELGADDYMTKPFGMRELVARIKANIRRASLTLGPEIDQAQPSIHTFGDIVIDMNRYEIRKRGELINLTLREFELLRYLADHADKVFDREDLLRNVWGYEYYGDIRTVDVTVRRLREKIEDEPGDPKYIMTRRGVGYYFRTPA